MFNPAELNGRLVVLAARPERLEVPEGAKCAPVSTYYDGEYFVVSSTRHSIQGVKLSTGYGGHECRSFTDRDYEVVDAYDEPDVVSQWLDDLEDFAQGGLKDAREGRNKRWVDTVYSDALANVRRARRMIARRGESAAPSARRVIALTVPADVSVLVNGEEV